MNTTISVQKKKLWLRLFYSMLRLRLVEERIASEYPKQEMRCPVHLSIGQEAVSVGVCENLKKNDYVLSSHRSHGFYLSKGGDLNSMISELYGKEDGCTHGKGGSMHLFDLHAGFLGSIPIVGSAIALAAGVAFGSQLKNEKRITTVFFGDGAVEEGIFHETLNFAAVKRLPLLFVCENNFYSVYSPLSVRQPLNREIAAIARGHGIKSFEGDGNNILEVYELTKKAINYINHNKGPAFLELKTYRWREHCGCYYDNNLGYRTEEEFLSWKDRCPIELFQQYLTDQNVLDTKSIDTLSKEIDEEINFAFNQAIEGRFPDKNELFKHIYAD